MIEIYTTPSCSSCRKAKKWFEEHKIEYREKNLFSNKITHDDIIAMLKNTENGFEDIISTRSKIFKDNNLNVEDMTFNELKNFIIDNPSILKRPIIVDRNKMQVGYNDEEIRVFLPRRLREIIMCECTDKEDCDYRTSLNKYLSEIREEQKKGNV